MMLYKDKFNTYKMSLKNLDDTEIILHENILDILFKHKQEIYRKFSDIRGALLIDHIAIKIIDPNNKLIIFSSTPSVEYNLLVQGLWKHDKSFSKFFHQNNTFYPWDKAYSAEFYDKLKNIKEIKHKFTLGLNIAKQINNFTIVYSYATRSPNNDLYEYYAKYQRELYNLGDYGYNLLSNIYSYYCDPRFNMPTFSDDVFPQKPFLYLLTERELCNES